MQLTNDMECSVEYLLHYFHRTFPCDILEYFALRLKHIGDAAVVVTVKLH
jgi:hypothetical protein